MTPFFRLNPARREILHREFTYAALELVRHMGAEAQVQCNALFGPLIADDSAPATRPWKRTLSELPSRLRSQAEALQRLNKRAPVSVTVPLSVDGEFSKQFGAVWKAFRTAAGNPWTKGDATVEVQKGIITLDWGRGCYRIFSGVLLTGDKFTGYEGRIEISSDLLARGGAYQIERSGETLRLVSLQGRMATWRLALAFIREDRIRRGSFSYRSLLQRFRSGAKISYSAVQTRSYTNTQHTEVTLSGGKADLTFEKLLVSRQAQALSFAERVERYIAGLTTWAKAEAEKFAAPPSLQLANAERELVEAQESFNEASTRLFNLTPKVCYKSERPAEPFTSHPGKLPAMKSVSDSLSRQYRGVCGTFESAWERLLEARKNAPTAATSVVLQPPAPTVAEAPLSLATFA